MFDAIARAFRKYPVAAPVLTGGAVLAASRMLAPESTGRTVAMVAGAAGIALGGARAIGVLPSGGVADILRGNPRYEDISRMSTGSLDDLLARVSGAAHHESEGVSKRELAYAGGKELAAYARRYGSYGAATRAVARELQSRGERVPPGLRDNPTLHTRHGSYNMKAACTGRGKAAAALAGSRWHPDAPRACAPTSAGRVLGARSWPEGKGGLTKARAHALAGARRAEAEIHTAARGVAQSRGISPAKALAEVRARHAEVRRAMGR